MRSWFQATLIRVVRTGAQAALASIGAAVAFAEVAWDEVAAVTGFAMIISFLMALAGLPETPDPSPVQKMAAGEEGQVQNLALVLVFLIGFLLGALCYANGIIVGD